MKLGVSRRLFLNINNIFLGFMGLLCLLPIINLLAISLSSRNMVQANMVQLIPRQITISSYKYVLQTPAFYKALVITIYRLVVGLLVNLSMTVLVAYPLSKSDSDFRLRRVYVMYFLIVMVFSGGLIPTYLVVNQMGLNNSIWALVLPNAVYMFLVLLMLNFFRGIPKEIEEAAVMDGAKPITTMTRIYLPLSLPSIATVTLFILVHHWNSWFDGLIYMNTPDNYPLMTYLQSVVLKFNISDISAEKIMFNPDLAELTGRSVKSASIILCTLPILISYPFLQRYFVQGLVLGSVKG